MDIDVTDKVTFQNNDDEALPVTECVCGRRYSPWEFVISIYRDTPVECPACGRKLYFKLSISVMEIKD